MSTRGRGRRVRQRQSTEDQGDIPTELDPRFLDLDAQAKFHASSSKSIIKGKILNANSNFDSYGLNVGTLFRNQGLEYFLANDMAIYPILVREFYANLRFRTNPVTRRKDKTTLISRVHGIDIELNVQNLSTIFQIPTSDDQLDITDTNSVTLLDTTFDFQTALNAMSEIPQTIGDAKVVNLSLPCHLIHRVIHINLHKKSGSKDAVHLLDIYLTWAVWTGRPINWSGFIFYLLAAGGKRKDSNLMFGRALSKIFEAYAIDLTNTELLELNRFDYFNESLLNLMRYKLVNGQWIRRTPLPAPDPTQVAGSSSAPTLLRLTSLMVHRLLSIASCERYVRVS